MAALTAPQLIKPDEQATASTLRGVVTPVLANGVVCAMRDEPADVAGYMAEYLATAGAGAALILDQRKFGQECARLDAEFESLKEQLDVARAERARRVPHAADSEAMRNATVASASWSEVRRLKRLVRSMKIKIAEPLSASDWPLSEGVLLMQGPEVLQPYALCEQLGADFGVASVDISQHDPLGAVIDGLKRRAGQCVLLNGYLETTRAREQLDLFARRVGLPTALLLLDCAPDMHAQLLVADSEEAGAKLSREAADEAAFEWANTSLPTLEAAAREASVPVLRVSCDGDFNARMTNLLVAACAA